MWTINGMTFRASPCISANFWGRKKLTVKNYPLLTFYSALDKSSISKLCFDGDF